MSLSIKTALQARDTKKLEALLSETPALSNVVISWGDGGSNRATALHFLSHLIFEEELDQQKAIELAEILLHYGADLNGVHEKTQDTALIAASSFGAENYALWLLSADADYQKKGLFGASVLHWAAMLGQDRLVEGLLHLKADIMLRDEENHGTPLDWAIYGWKNDDIPARTNRQPICAAFLVGVGSPVTGGMLSQLNSEEDSLMLAVLEPELIETEKKKSKKANKEEK